MRRRKINVFSLSFLDCICCGLGAVILLFVIVNAKSAVHRDEVTTDLRSEVTRFEKEVLEGKKGLIRARNALEKTVEELVTAQGLSPELIKTIEEKKIELAHYENDTLATKAHIKKLKTDLKSREEDVRRLEAQYPPQPHMPEFLCPNQPPQRPGWLRPVAEPKGVDSLLLSEQSFVTSAVSL